MGIESCHLQPWALGLLYKRIATMGLPGRLTGCAVGQAIPLFGNRRPSSAPTSFYCRSRQPLARSQAQRQEDQQEVGPSLPGSSSSMASSVLAARTTAAAALLALPLLLVDPASALQLHQEPANALSLPTWAVHTSSVIEWATAMGLIWEYGEVSGMPQWKVLTWAMLPCFFSAMCACTWHFFYNDTAELQFLVVLQAALTILGNCTCCWAAYRIYQAAQQRA